MNKKKIVKLGLQIVIYLVVGLFMYFAVRDKVSDLKDYSISNFWLLLLSVPLFSLNVAINSWTWHTMMDFSGEKIPFMESMNVYVSSFIVRYIPGNVWAIIARAVMNKKFGVNMMKTAWGWLIENITFLMVGMLFSLFVLASVYKERPEVLIVVLIALPVCIVFLLRYELIGKLFNFLVKKKFKKYYDKNVEMLELSFRHKLTLVGMYGLSWLAYSLHYFVVVNAVTGVGIDKFFLITGINALAWSVGYMSIITPSGGGVREGIMILALTTLGIMGEVDAVVVTLIARLAFIAGELLYFAFTKLVYFLWNRNGKSK
ncbi:flippase-like domain-containing protein [Candidatus Dojkabacteria bacterium]|nr:flippase-like domain-containing protein [Candidatus Dojkabacteria bacterium]